MLNGTLRIASYNIAHGDVRDNLDVVLKAIGDEEVNGIRRPIDVLAIQEASRNKMTTEAVSQVLNNIYGPATYTAGELIGETTGGGRPGIVYRTDTVSLCAECDVAIGESRTDGQPRQAIRYLLHPIGFESDADFYLYNSHYKAGTGPPDPTDPSKPGDLARRKTEAEAIRNDADSLGDAQILFVGDFNARSSDEPAFQELLRPGVGVGQAIDPMNRLGDWYGNVCFGDTFTQAPEFSPLSGLTEGGLDDRFDFQLVSSELLDGEGIDIIPNSYHSFGNNGTVPVDGDVDDPVNTAIPGFPNRGAVLNSLTTVSDHLPVVADYVIYEELPTLTVESLVTTRNGFTAQFNRGLEISELNLYDTQLAGLGPADVTVVGTSSGPVSGSVVVDPSSQAITFIKTGGPLTADTYEVTLRSATDGFQAPDGTLLDGDRDGNPGGDFVRSFTVDPLEDDTVTVSLPDFVRGPGQEVNVPASDTAAGIPLTISEGAGVRNVSVQISYDPLLLEITGATTVHPRATVDLSYGFAPGLVAVTFSSPSDLPAGSNNFVNLQAAVPTTNSASRSYNSGQILDVHVDAIDDGNGTLFPAVADDALHIVQYFGDVSGNGRINSSDAAQVGRVAAILDSGFAATRLTDPTIVGDISGNGRINAADASLLAQVAAMIDVPQIPPVPSGITVCGSSGLTQTASVRGLSAIVTPLLLVGQPSSPAAAAKPTDDSASVEVLESAPSNSHPAMHAAMSNVGNRSIGQLEDEGLLLLRKARSTSCLPCWRGNLLGVAAADQPQLW